MTAVVARAARQWSRVAPRIVLGQPIGGRIDIDATVAKRLTQP